MTDDEDVPYGEDFHDAVAAAEWAEAAMRKRPWRVGIFERFADAVRGVEITRPRLLELGSGPGFLAEHVLDACPSVAEYVLFDFSEPMLDLSRQRLARHATRTRFVRGNFKSDTWPAVVAGPFDLVCSLQAVHELRHKRHAPRLYQDIRSVVAPGGTVVICDHLPEIAVKPRHHLLYMTLDEQIQALTSAGFIDPRVLWNDHHMAMYRATSR
jgi:SAM-dependent methyltransferase